MEEQGGYTCPTACIETGENSQHQDYVCRCTSPITLDEGYGVLQESWNGTELEHRTIARSEITSHNQSPEIWFPADITPCTIVSDPGAAFAEFTGPRSVIRETTVKPLQIGWGDRAMQSVVRFSNITTRLEFHARPLLVVAVPKRVGAVAIVAAPLSVLIELGLYLGHILCPHRRAAPHRIDKISCIT